MTRVLYPTTDLSETETLIIVRGKGVYVYDDQGRRYLEGMAGLWCASLGYGNEELAEAAAAQLRTLSYQQLFGGKTHKPAMELAERLSAMLPVRGARLFFGTTGSDANDTHWKLLRYYFNSIGKPEKRKIIAREGAYHGVTVAASAMTGLAANHAHFGLPFNALGILRTDATHYYRQAMGSESEEEFAARLVGNLEKLILREDPRTIAAFIAEPVAGAGGVIIPPRTYWEQIQKVLRTYDILLIDDEVITGFGRTGNDFGATKYGITPDFMTLAKGLTSGYLPLSVAAIPGEVYEQLAESSSKLGVFGHGYTYSGHPVSCAVALKTLEIYERDRTFEHARVVGCYLQTRLRSLDSHPLVGNVRGVGLIGALELVADRTTRRPFEGRQVGLYAQARAQTRGLITRALPGSSLGVCPPLIITEAEIDELIDALGSALDDTLAFASREGLMG